MSLVNTGMVLTNLSSRVARIERRGNNIGLSKVLAVSNTTDGNDIIISNSDNLILPTVLDNSTNGFVRLSTTFGVPTGVPTTGEGSVVFNTENDQVYFYSENQNQWITPGGGGGGGGSPNLQNVLQSGNETGGNNIVLSNGDIITDSVIGGGVTINTIANGVGSISLLSGSTIFIQATQPGEQVQINSGGSTSIAAGTQLLVNTAFGMDLSVSASSQYILTLNATSGNGLHIRANQTATPMSSADGTVIANSTDMAGQVTLTDDGTNKSITITFTNAYVGTNYIVVLTEVATPGNVYGPFYVDNVLNTSFTIRATNTFTGTATINYFIIDLQ